MGANRRVGGPVLLAVIIVGGLFALFCYASLLPFGEISLTVAFGWPRYLGRVVPQLRPDPWMVVSGVVYLLGVVLGSHLFLRWVYTASGPDGEPRRWPWRWTLQLVGVVVLMFVAGIAVTGMVHQTGWLVRSPVPLTASSHARRTSQDNIKGMVINAHRFADANKGEPLPRSTFDASGQPLHSWQTFYLPFIEQTGLYTSINFSKPWSHPENAEAMKRWIHPFLNPAFPGEMIEGRFVSHYAGNVAVVLTDTPKTMQSFPQGTSNTIFCGEVASNFRAWGDPLNARDPRLGPTGHPDGFGGPRGQPAQFGMLDGSVRTFNPKELADLMAGKVPE